MFNKVLLPKGTNKKDAIDEVLTRLTSFAQSNNVIVLLVAHPTKMKKNETGKYEMPTLYDVSGSADFRNQTHNGFCIYRHFESEDGGAGYTQFVNLKTKFSFQGRIGESVNMNYHIPTGRYYAMGTHEPLFDMTEEHQEKQSALVPNTGFDDFTPLLDDDLPF